MRVSKWGKSLAVRLPKRLAKALGIADADDVSIVSANPENRCELKKR